MHTGLCKDIVGVIAGYLYPEDPIKSNLYDLFINQEVYSEEDWNFCAQYGRLRMMKWLYKNTDKRECSKTTFNIAAEYGHLDILKFLMKKNKELGVYSNTPTAMNKAAKNGHLAVLKWLYHHMKYKCTMPATNMAIRNGHLETVKWLNEVVKAKISKLAIDYAAEYGHLDIIIYLIANVPNKICTPTKRAFHIAAEHGYMNIVKYLYKVLHSYELDEIMRCSLYGAVRNGHFGIVKFLYKKLPSEYYLAGLHSSDYIRILSSIKYISKAEASYITTYNDISARTLFEKLLNCEITVEELSNIRKSKWKTIGPNVAKKIIRLFD
jgi:hypothetical protein